MQEFNYLIKKRGQALSLFDKVIRKLAKVQEELNTLITHSKSQIDRATKEIESHNSKIEFLNTELQTTTAQKSNVEKLTGIQSTDRSPSPV